MSKPETECPTKQGEKRKPGTFVKGDPRCNRGGRPKGQTIRAQLKSIAAEEIVIEGVRMTKGDAILRRIVNGALAADPVQQKYYLEYLYGKPIQSVELDTTVMVAPYNEENRRMALKLLGITEGD